MFPPFIINIAIAFACFIVIVREKGRPSFL